jgi:hypothetical protein
VNFVYGRKPPAAPVGSFLATQQLGGEEVDTRIVLSAPRNPAGRSADKLSRRWRCAPLVGVDPLGPLGFYFVRLVCDMGLVGPLFTDSSRRSFILIPIDGQTAVITGHHLGVQDNVTRSSSRVTKFGSTRIRVNPALGLIPLHCGH